MNWDGNWSRTPSTSSNAGPHHQQQHSQWRGQNQQQEQPPWRVPPRDAEPQHQQQQQQQSGWQGPPRDSGPQLQQQQPAWRGPPRDSGPDQKPPPWRDQRPEYGPADQKQQPPWRDQRPEYGPADQKQQPPWRDQRRDSGPAHQQDALLQGKSSNSGPVRSHNTPWQRQPTDSTHQDRLQRQRRESQDDSRPRHQQSQHSQSQQRSTGKPADRTQSSSHDNASQGPRPSLYVRPADGTHNSCGDSAVPMSRSSSCTSSNVKKGLSTRYGPHTVPQCVEKKESSTPGRALDAAWNPHSGMDALSALFRPASGESRSFDNTRREAAEVRSSSKKAGKGEADVRSSAKGGEGCWKGRDKGELDVRSSAKGGEGRSQCISNVKADSKNSMLGRRGQQKREGKGMGMERRTDGGDRVAKDGESSGTNNGKGQLQIAKNSEGRQDCGGKGQSSGGKAGEGGQVNTGKGQSIMATSGVGCQAKTGKNQSAMTTKGGSSEGWQSNAVKNQSAMTTKGGGADGMQTNAGKGQSVTPKGGDGWQSNSANNQSTVATKSGGTEGRQINTGKGQSVTTKGGQGWETNEGKNHSAMPTKGGGAEGWRANAGKNQSSMTTKGGRGGDGGQTNEGKNQSAMTTKGSGSAEGWQSNAGKNQSSMTTKGSRGGDGWQSNEGKNQSSMTTTGSRGGDGWQSNAGTNQSAMATKGSGGAEGCQSNEGKNQPSMTTKGSRGGDRWQSNGGKNQPSMTTKGSRGGDGWQSNAGSNQPSMTTKGSRGGDGWQSNVGTNQPSMTTKGSLGGEGRETHAGTKGGDNGNMNAQKGYPHKDQAMPSDHGKNKGHSSTARVPEGKNKGDHSWTAHAPEWIHSNKSNGAMCNNNTYDTHPVNEPPRHPGFVARSSNAPHKGGNPAHQFEKGKPEHQPEKGKGKKRSLESGGATPWGAEEKRRKIDRPSCGVCSKDFSTPELLQKHFDNDHIKCDHCDFSGPEFVMECHKLRHQKGLDGMDIGESLEETKAWIESRRRNFPTKKLIQHKRDVQAGRVDRGALDGGKELKLSRLEVLLRAARRDDIQTQREDEVEDKPPSGNCFNYYRYSVCQNAYCYFKHTLRSPNAPPIPVCRFFLTKGYCNSGNRCRNSHDIDKSARNGKRKEPKCLLKKLLQPEINRHYSQVLQAIRFLTRTNFGEMSVEDFRKGVKIVAKKNEGAEEIEDVDLEDDDFEELKTSDDVKPAVSAMSPSLEEGNCPAGSTDSEEDSGAPLDDAGRLIPGRTFAAPELMEAYNILHPPENDLQV